MPENALRTLTGAPIYHYTVADLEDEIIWDLIKSGHDSSYLMTTGTSGYLNDCGVPAAHAYAIISAFFLRDEHGRVAHKMLMIRDPKGRDTYQDKWNSKDKASWTPEFIAQVPRGINPLRPNSFGVFFIEHIRYGRCFESFQIAHQREQEGYKETWYDIENDDGDQTDLSFTVPESKQGTIYITAETYVDGAVPWESHCAGQAPLQVLFIGTKNTTTGKYHRLAKSFYRERVEQPLSIDERHYKAGDQIGVFVRYEWGRVPEGARDITVKLYSKMDLALVDEHNRTNQYKMDTLEAFDGIEDDFWN